MNNAVSIPESQIPTKLSIAAEKATDYILRGDLSRLTEQERVQYCVGLCQSLGINHLINPIEFIPLNGKLKPYAKKECTDQLRKVYKVSVRIVSRESVNGVHVVIARAILPDGREDESSGACSIEGLKGEKLCNSLMRAETKAKRRVTLSICSLGILDESEFDTIPKAAFDQPLRVHRGKQELRVTPRSPEEENFILAGKIQKEFMRVSGDDDSRKQYLKDSYDFRDAKDLIDKGTGPMEQMLRELKELDAEKLDSYMNETMDMAGSNFIENP